MSIMSVREIVFSTVLCVYAGASIAYGAELLKTEHDLRKADVRHEETIFTTQYDIGGFDDNRDGTLDRLIIERTYVASNATWVFSVRNDFTPRDPEFSRYEKMIKSHQ